MKRAGTRFRACVDHSELKAVRQKSLSPTSSTFGDSLMDLRLEQSGIKFFPIFFTPVHDCVSTWIRNRQLERNNSSTSSMLGG